MCVEEKMPVQGYNSIYTGMSRRAGTKFKEVHISKQMGAGLSAGRLRRSLVSVH